jgi:hypothetical protein
MAEKTGAFPCALIDVYGVLIRKEQAAELSKLSDFGLNSPFGFRSML